MAAVFEKSLKQFKEDLIRSSSSVVLICLVMGSRTIRRCHITLCAKQNALSKGLISRATAGDRIRCLGRWKPASFAVWRVGPNLRSMKQSRIIYGGSLAGRRGKMGLSTTYAEVTKLVTRDSIIVPTTRHTGVGWTEAGS